MFSTASSDSACSRLQPWSSRTSTALISFAPLLDASAARLWPVTSTRVPSLPTHTTTGGAFAWSHSPSSVVPFL